MANRVFRTGMLSSERVAGLSDRAFRLYVSLLLTADDFGLVELGYGPIKEANALQAWTRDDVAAMLAEVEAAALLRPYEVGGKRLGAIERWESTINTRQPKHALPPWGTGHVRRVLGCKDAQTRIAVAKYFSHLAYPSGAPVPPTRVHGGDTSAPLVTEGGTGKGKRTKEGQGDTSGALFHGPAAWDCPDGVDPHAWSDWLKVRRRKKASESPRTYADVCARIAAWRASGYDPSAIVAKSADSGWTDLYQPNGSASPAGRPASPMRSDRPGDLGSFDTTGLLHQQGGSNGS